MRFLRRSLDGLTNLFRRKKIDDDLDEELEAFLDAAAEQYEREGRTPDEARRAARTALGSREAVKESVRDARWESMLDDVGRDVAFACRYLNQHRGFATAAILTLGLGIGIATAVFSVVNTVLVQPLPYKDADRLVRIVERAAPSTAGAPLLRRTRMSWSEMLEWRKRTALIEEMAYTMSPPNTLMSSGEGALRLNGALVSTNLFTMLGANARIGRALDGRDEAAGTSNVVISTSAWQRYFGARPDIIGQSVSLKTLGPQTGMLDGRSLTVVGVMPERFDYPAPYIDYWAPIAEDSPLRRSPSQELVIGRLKADVTLRTVNAEVNVIGEAIVPRPTSGPLSRPLPPGVTRFDVEGMEERAVASSRPALRALGVAVGILLLLACANVSALLLARGFARQREIATRLALGASRGRVARQVATESGLMAFAGGALGVIVAAGAIRVLRVFASPNAEGPFLISFGDALVPRLHELSIDPTMLAIAFLTSLVTAVIVGIVPALAVVRSDHVRSSTLLGAASAQRGASPSSSRLQDALIVLQVALAMTLLIGGGLVVGSFSRLVNVDPGWNASRLLTFYLAMPQEYDPDRRSLVVRRLLEDLQSVPGVTGTGFTYAGPLLGLVDTYGVFVPAGKTVDEMRENTDKPHVRSVSYDFLETMGAKLAAGRSLGPGDDANAPPVLVVNRTLARRFFGGRDPVGELVHFDGRLDFPAQRIVGVVEDMRQGRLDKEPTPQMFFEYRQLLALLRERQAPRPQQERLVFGFQSFVVRTDGSPESLMATVRQRIRGVDPTVGIDMMAPMDRLVTSSLTRERFYATLTGVFAVSSALLSAIGLYGVLAYGVARRTSEIGIRMALGAKAGDVRRLVLRRGLRLFVVGVVAGVAAAAALTRFITTMLYGVAPSDPTTYAAAIVLFAAVVALACWLPARRATRVDPIMALRCE